MQVESPPPSERLQKFREILKKHKLDGFVVVHNDPHDV